MAKKEKIKLNKFEKWFRFLRRMEKIFVHPFFPYKKLGRTKLFNERPYLFVCNHYSLLDVIFPAVATDKPVHFIAKKDLFEKGLMKKFVNKCQCIPVNRDGTDVKAIMQAMKYLKGGESVVIFPEGTRNKSEQIFLPFKGGATAISVKTKTPIVPIVQNRKIGFLKRSYVYYGEPLEFSEYYGQRLTEEDIKICDEILRNRMLEMYNEIPKLKDKKKTK